MHELHRIVTGLRRWSAESEPSRVVDDSFDGLRAFIASESARREADRDQRHEAILEAPRISGERLATSLTLPVLIAALLARLPRFGIMNAMISLHAVKDTGGIPEEHLSRILDPFFTARQRPGSTGTGLGLAIVQRLVKECLGYLRVDSRVGTGTTFGLYFPLVGGAASLPSETPSPAVRGSGRILVVDDEAVQLRTARRILTQLGYEVVTASSGVEGFDKLVSALSTSGFDLVILDMLMPGGETGLATLERMRAVCPEQRAMMVTGFSSQRATDIQGDRDVTWLAKPYTVGALAAAVRRILETPSQDLD